MRRDRILFFFLFLIILMMLFSNIACAAKESPPDLVSGEDAGFSYAWPAWPALALLKTGENPIWFELGPAGPAQIESPDAASLVPYLPWPYARFVTEMAAWDDLVVMVINQDGFLVLGPATDTAAAVLYRADSGGSWEYCTAESFFFWEGKPAVLLYRNDFFNEPVAPSPSPQVYTLERTGPFPVGVSVPALEYGPLDSSWGPWEAEVLHLGPDGFWYFRLKEKGRSQNQTAFFRTGDLAEAGERISVAEWRNSDRPGNSENVSPVLAFLLGRVQAELNLENVPAVRVILPDSLGPRLFTAGSAFPNAAGSENLVLLYACCTDKLALAILPDGRGLWTNETRQDVRAFSLPALPEGFVYTGVSLLGTVLAVSWEEQQEAGIGAAGFLVMRMPGISIPGINKP